jgi:hypothetical protein
MNPLADWERDLLGPQNEDGRYWHRRAVEAEAKLAAWDADHQNALDLAAERATAAEAKLAKIREVIG